MQPKRGASRACDLGRRLSAKLTEGLFNCSIDMLADSAKVLIDFVIGNADDFQAVAFQKSSSLGVVFDTSVLVMLRTVQFNNQFRFRTVEINDIFAQYLLPQKSDWIGAEIIVPKVSFFFCHFLAQMFC